MILIYRIVLYFVIAVGYAENLLKRVVFYVISDYWVEPFDEVSEKKQRIEILKIHNSISFIRFIILGIHALVHLNYRLLVNVICNVVIV